MRFGFDDAPGRTLCRAEACFLVAILLIGSGCVRSQVQARASAEVDAASFASVYVPPVVVQEEAVSPDSGIPAWIEKTTRERISEKGCEVANATGADLMLQSSVAVEVVQRTTWDGDPDANSLVLRDFDEAVLVLRAIDQTSLKEVWKVEARGRLPKPDLLIGRKRETVWRNLLLDAIGRLPQRRAEDDRN